MRNSKDEVLIETLKMIPLFAKISDEEIIRLKKIVFLVVFKKNEMLWQKGEPNEFLYILLSGKLKVISEGPHGQELTYSYIAPYEYFGEMSLLGSSPHSATVMAMEDSLCLMLCKKDFLELIEKYPRIAIYMLQVMSNRLNDISEELSDLKFLDVYQRTAKCLFCLSSKCDDKTVRFSHQELANHVCTSRENATRALNVLEKNNIIKIEKQKITVLKPENLEEIFNK